MGYKHVKTKGAYTYHVITLEEGGGGISKRIRYYT